MPSLELDEVFRGAGAPARLDRPAQASTSARPGALRARSRPSPCRAGLQATLRPYQTEGVAFLQRLRAERRRRRPGRRDGARQDAADDRPLLRRTGRGAPRRAGARRRADEPRRQLGARARQVRAPPARRRPPRPRAARALARGRRRRTSSSRRTRSSSATRSASREQPFHLVVLDEAQTIKNARSQARRALERAPGRRTALCLTGTPVENHLGELWSLFDWLVARPPRRRARVPPLLAAADRAARRRRAPRGAARAGRAVRPPPPEARRRERAPAEDRALGARRARAASSASSTRPSASRRTPTCATPSASKGLAASAVTILDALTKLRQVCCDPRLVAMDAARAVRESAKLEALFEPCSASSSRAGTASSSSRSSRACSRSSPRRSEARDVRYLVLDRRDARPAARRRRVRGGPGRRVPHQPQGRRHGAEPRRAPTPSSTTTRGGTPPRRRRRPIAPTASDRSARCSCTTCTSPAASKSASSRCSRRSAGCRRRSWATPGRPRPISEGEIDALFAPLEG